MQPTNRPVNAVELRDVTKTFGKVVANDHVSLDIRKGEILSLLGENGSGKTTLMNMLAGIYFPDSGQILVDGKEVSIRSPKDSFALHIGMIHQHFKLVDVFSAAENIVLGLKDKGKFDRKAISQQIRDISSKYGFDLDPDKKIYDMAVSEKQTVEIIKVLYRGADILILDEPTAVLTPQETEKLFSVLRNMRADGKSIVIITHKLNEVMAISDRVSVLRKGQFIATVNTSQTSPQQLTDMMVGHAVTLNIDRPEPKDPQDRLEVKGLTCLDGQGVKVLDDVSFAAKSGEILGIAGIAGSGQRELCEAIAGRGSPVAERPHRPGAHHHHRPGQRTHRCPQDTGGRSGEGRHAGRLSGAGHAPLHRGQLQGDPDRQHPGWAARGDPYRHLPRPYLQGPCGEHLARHRGHLLPAAQGYLVRQLHQGRPAHPGAHRLRARAGAPAGDPLRHVGHHPHRHRQRSDGSLSRQRAEGGTGCIGKKTAGLLRPSPARASPCGPPARAAVFSSFPCSSALPPHGPTGSR